MPGVDANNRLKKVAASTLPVQAISSYYFLDSEIAVTQNQARLLQALTRDFQKCCGKITHLCPRRTPGTLFTEID
jgi:uncharacterized protein involved in tolerance to divalent cations